MAPKSLRPKSCDHQGQGYIGAFLSKELSLVTWPKCADDPQVMKEHTQIPIYGYV